MSTIKLGVIKEGKNPPDKRVPLTPAQCIEVQDNFDNVKIIVQHSNVRAFKDQEYADLGIEMSDDVSDCDILMGVKEVNIEDLIPSKKYMFFSHTFKEQPYNRKLLKAILERNIQLIDYEVLKNKNDTRIIGFGRYAGIVGCYNGILAYGLKHGLYNLKPANQCADRIELEAELKKVSFPANTKIVATGFGRVGNGAREIFESLGLKEVNSTDFLNQDFDEAVFTHLTVADYFARADGSDFDKYSFYESGEGHVSTFDKFLRGADMYIACHYWDASSPFIFTREDLKSSDIRTSVVADISCDIDGPVASTLRPSTISSPVYGYDPQTESEVDFMQKGAIGVMAVDNLPCELPKDASLDFGNELITQVFPALFQNDPDRIIARASETNLQGELTEEFSYLSSYIAVND